MFWLGVFGFALVGAAAAIIILGFPLLREADEHQEKLLEEFDKKNKWAIQVKPIR